LNKLLKIKIMIKMRININQKMKVIMKIMKYNKI